MNTQTIRDACRRALELDSHTLCSTFWDAIHTREEREFVAYASTFTAPAARTILALLDAVEAVHEVEGNFEPGFSYEKTREALETIATLWPKKSP